MFIQLPVEMCHELSRAAARTLNAQFIDGTVLPVARNNDQLRRAEIDR